MSTAARSSCVAALLWALPVHGAEPNAVLKGLKGLSVMVATGSTFESKGLSSGQLRTDVELRLRKAGIPVVEDSPDSFTFLQVHLTNACFPRTGHEQCAYTVWVSLHEPVQLVRNPAMSHQLAQTWHSTGATGVVGTDPGAPLSMDNQRALREAVADEVDEFSNAFLAANPVGRSR